MNRVDGVVNDGVMHNRVVYHRVHGMGQDWEDIMFVYNHIQLRHMDGVHGMRVDGVSLHWENILLSYNYLNLGSGVYWMHGVVNHNRVDWVVRDDPCRCSCHTGKK